MHLFEVYSYVPRYYVCIHPSKTIYSDYTTDILYTCIRAPAPKSSVIILLLLCYYLLILFSLIYVHSSLTFINVDR